MAIRVETQSTVETNKLGIWQGFLIDEKEELLQIEVTPESIHEPPKIRITRPNGDFFVLVR